MKRFIFTILLLTGCTQASGGRDVTIHFNYRTPSPLVYNIAKSIMELNSSLNDSMFKFGPGPNNYNVTIEYSEAPFKNVAGTAQNMFTYCRIVIYPTSIQNNILKTVVWHEIGHCLGLNHNGYFEHIMSEHVKPFETYNQEEVNLFLLEIKKLRGKQ
jgi:hypothetical protein